MLSSTISLRVRYGETDQMGVVYHGNYPTYLEVARVEFFRHIGLPYRELEDFGIYLPVVELSIKYLQPAYYDQMLFIHTILLEIPTGARLKFDYEIKNEAGDLLTKAHSTLAFINKETRKPVLCPNYMKNRLFELLNSKNP